jgi:hypothetical protein
VQRDVAKDGISRDERWDERRFIESKGNVVRKQIPEGCRINKKYPLAFIRRLKVFPVHEMEKRRATRISNVNRTIS